MSPLLSTEPLHLVLLLFCLLILIMLLLSTLTSDAGTSQPWELSAWPLINIVMSLIPTSLPPCSPPAAATPRAPERLALVCFITLQTGLSEQPRPGTRTSAREKGMGGGFSLWGGAGGEDTVSLEQMSPGPEQPAGGDAAGKGRAGARGGHPCSPRNTAPLPPLRQPN